MLTINIGICPEVLCEKVLLEISQNSLEKAYA